MSDEELRAENARLDFIMEMVRDWWESGKAQAAGEPLAVIAKGNAMLELMHRYELYAISRERLDCYMKQVKLIRENEEANEHGTD